MENYIKLKGQKIKLTDEQVAEIRKSFGFDEMKLSSVEVGDTFKIGKYEFVVLEHIGDTVAVILKNLLYKNEAFGKDNNYKGSHVDDLCTEFAEKLEDIAGEEIFKFHEVDLTSDDGLKDYGDIVRRVSLLTANQYRRYVEILDKHKVDKWWWLATAYSTPTHNHSSWVKCVSPSGDVGDGNCNINYDGVRPFCILKSNIFVSK